jgi:WD40 repeat protein
LILQTLVVPLSILLASLAFSQEVRILEGHKDTVGSVSFPPDGSLPASAAADGTIRIWGASTGGELVEFEGNGDSVFVFTISFSPDGRFRASGSSDKMVRLWKISVTPS